MKYLTLLFLATGLSLPIFAADPINCPQTNPSQDVQIVSCDEKFRNCLNDGSGPHRKVTFNPNDVGGRDWSETVTNNVTLFSSDNLINTVTIQGSTLSNLAATNESELTCFYNSTNHSFLAEDFHFVEDDSSEYSKVISDDYTFDEKTRLTQTSAAMNITLIESTTTANLRYTITLKDIPITMTTNEEPGGESEGEITSMTVGGDDKSGELKVTNTTTSVVNRYSFDLSFSCSNESELIVDCGTGTENMRNFGNAIPLKLTGEANRQLFGFKLYRLETNDVVGFLRIDVDNDPTTNTEIYHFVPETNFTELMEI